MIEIRNLHKSFGDKAILKGIDYEVRPGDRLAIIGKSGTGKSVAVKILLGFVEKDEGDVLFEGQSIDDFNAEDWRALYARVGMVFQNNALFDSLTIWENIGIKAIEENESIESVRNRVSEILPKVKLDTNVMEQLPDDLSGGMRKRVAIARALFNLPAIIVFDEPTSGLDPMTSEAIDDLILETSASLEACILITHDMRSVRKVATKVIMLDQGKAVFYGDVDQFFNDNNPLVRQAISRFGY